MPTWGELLQELDLDLRPIAELHAEFLERHNAQELLAEADDHLTQRENEHAAQAENESHITTQDDRHTTTMS